MTRTQQINALADALTYYREHKPQDPRQQRRVITQTAIKFGIGLKLMLSAIQIMSGVDTTASRRNEQ